MTLQISRSCFFQKQTTREVVHAHLDEIILRSLDCGRGEAQLLTSDWSPHFLQF